MKLTTMQINAAKKMIKAIAPIENRINNLNEKKQDFFDKINGEITLLDNQKQAIVNAIESMVPGFTIEDINCGIYEKVDSSVAAEESEEYTLDDIKEENNSFPNFSID